MGKFTHEERALIKSIVASLTIKRIPDPEIMKDVFNQTGKTISRRAIVSIRQRIKKDSYKWYQKMKNGQWEYIHEFKERINEITDLQKKHHELIAKYPNRPYVIQTSLAELHRLNITLSNYFDVAPSIVEVGYTSNENMNKDNKNEHSLSVSQQNKEIIV